MDQKHKHKHGFTLGKFMPPHTGHGHLIDQAARHVDQLTILVCSVEREPIPGKIRYEWMKELHPNHNVIHVTDDVPSYPHEHPDFWTIWKRLFKKYLSEETTVFFSGEPYGDDVARHLSIEHIMVDRTNDVNGASATAIRTDPFSNWKLIPEIVRPYFVRRIVLTGPESVGKTTMAKRLAEHFQTNCVEEYGRVHFDKVQGKLTLSDIEVIAATQASNEDKAARSSNKILFCDTDLMVTQVWSEIYFNKCPDSVLALNRDRKYDLWLLLDIDTPWVNDGTREFPHLREEHFARLKSELDRRGLPYKIISGDFEKRMDSAIEEVNTCLSTQL
jgi:HTH-type transcriptional repressor of NAD biosynthesis genes